MQILREGTTGKLSFKRIVPAVVLSSLLILFWTVVIADVLGRTDYHYWMDALMWNAGTLIPTLAPYILTRKNEV